MKSCAMTQALSMQTGEIVGKVGINDWSWSHGFLTMDGSRVWVHSQGWDFGTLSLLPVQLSNIPPHKLHPNGFVLWDIGLYRIRDTITGNVVFQLSTKYGKPIDVQWNCQYLLGSAMTSSRVCLAAKHKINFGGDFLAIEL